MKTRNQKIVEKIVSPEKLGTKIQRQLTLLAALAANVNDGDWEEVEFNLRHLIAVASNAHIDVQEIINR